MIKQKELKIKLAIMTSREVIKFLNISKQRLSQLVKSKKLVPIKHGVFLTEHVLKRKELQEELRKPYYKAIGKGESID